MVSIWAYPPYMFATLVVGRFENSDQMPATGSHTLTSGALLRPTNARWFESTSIPQMLAGVNVPCEKSSMALAPIWVLVSSRVMSQHPPADEAYIMPSLTSLANPAHPLVKGIFCGTWSEPFCPLASGHPLPFMNQMLFSQRMMSRLSRPIRLVIGSEVGSWINRSAGNARASPWTFSFE